MAGQRWLYLISTPHWPDRKDREPYDPIDPDIVRYRHQARDTGVLMMYNNLDETPIDGARADLLLCFESMAWPGLVWSVSVWCSMVLQQHSTCEVYGWYGISEYMGRHV